METDFVNVRMPYLYIILAIEMQKSIGGQTFGKNVSHQSKESIEV